MQYRVSIHAPTRGATSPWERKTRRADVSIHAPTRGATQYWRADMDNVIVSIHAPTRGATTSSSSAKPRWTRFQSTRPRGARPNRFMVWSCNVAKFQSTRPRGARPQASGPAQAGGGFQSTRPRGARLASPFAIAPHAIVSIHAPTRGATCDRQSIYDYAAFQSTRPRGARLQATYR